MQEDIYTGSVKYSNPENLQDKSLPANTLKSIPREVHAPGINLHQLVDTVRDSNEILFHMKYEMNICCDLPHDSLNSKMQIRFAFQNPF